MATLADRYPDGDRRRYCATATKLAMLRPLLQWVGWSSINADIATKSTVRSGIRLCHRARNCQYDGDRRRYTVEELTMYRFTSNRQEYP